MFNPFLAAVAPDFGGVPPEVRRGLVQVTDNAAAILLVISGAAIVASVIGLLLASWSGNRPMGERCGGMLALAVGALALVFLGAATANYTAGLFS